MSGDEELIITTEQFPLPPLPELPTLKEEKTETKPYTIASDARIQLLTELENVTEHSPVVVEHSPVVSDHSPVVVEHSPTSFSFMSIWSDLDNRSLIIHGLCDIILFYLAFRYVSSSFHKTKQHIHLCKQSIQDLKKQYGFIEE
jgi:hypothetical protein